MHMMFGLAVLFTIFVALCMLVGGWCWVCFRVGCWVIRSLSGGSASPRYASALPQPPAPPRLDPPRFDPYAYRANAGAASSRRRHGGGAKVVMTVVLVGLGVF